MFRAHKSFAQPKSRTNPPGPFGLAGALFGGDKNNLARSGGRGFRFRVICCRKRTMLAYTDSVAFLVSSREPLTFFSLNPAQQPALVICHDLSLHIVSNP